MPRYDHFHAKVKTADGVMHEIEGGWLGSDNPNAYSIEELHGIACNWGDLSVEESTLWSFGLAG